MTENRPAQPKLPRYFCAEVVEPGTPYPDEPTEMIPPGHYVLGGDDWRAETGPCISIKIDDAWDPDDEAGRDLAPQLAELLVRLLTEESARTAREAV